jgi:hypothetical protein
MDDAVWIENGYNLEYVTASKVFGRFIIRKQKLDASLNHVLRIGLSWMHPRAQKYELFVFDRYFVIRISFLYLLQNIVLNGTHHLLTNSLLLILLLLFLWSNRNQEQIVHPFKRCLLRHSWINIARKTWNDDLLFLWLDIQVVILKLSK